MRLQQLKNQLAAAREQLRPRPPAWKPKATTAETRQALDQLLSKIKNLPADAPPHSDITGLAAAQAECNRVLDILDRLYPAPRPT